MGSEYPASYWRARDLYFISLQAQGIMAVPCTLCGRLVDLQETGRHSQARSIHHRHALARGGEMLDTTWWQVTHLGCNSRLGARTQRVKATPPSRDW